MARARISFSESAISDLTGLRQWYADQGVAGTGKRVVSEVVERVEALREHPDLGRIVPEFGLRFLREVIHPPFRIVYRREPGKVRVVRVWRSERLLKLDPEG